MTLFGKDPEYLEVVAAEFLPDGSKLYILVADSDCKLHVLQYDPEGTLLMARPSEFSAHQYPTQTPNPPMVIASLTEANSTRATSQPR